MTRHTDDPQPIPSEDHAAGEQLPLIELETLLNRPLSRRKRLVQIGLMLAALVVVVVTFWNVAAPNTPPGQPVRLQPTSPPPTLTIFSNVNYGALTINGQPISSSPLSIKMHSQPPYTVTLDAPPFRPLSCSFPPPSPDPRYSFMACSASDGFTMNQQTVSTLEMLFTLADLPPDQQQQINTLIPRAVTAQRTITAPARSLIATGLAPYGAITSRRLTGPLAATAFLVPVRQDSQRGNFCQGFICLAPGGFLPNASLNGQFWEVATPVALRWRFTGASGQVVSDVTFPVGSILTLDLSYDAATGWQVGLLSPAQLSQHLAQLACLTGVNVLGGEAQRLNNQAYWNITTLHDQGIEGCELGLQLDTADQGHFVWRFGVLLAADAKAHSLLPALPIASPTDLAAVGG
ncbi:MAG TPA: hypothetical protein VH599_14020 [Ktedonobacterales bacterium]|jgi:hypothetical protein